MSALVAFAIVGLGSYAIRVTMLVLLAGRPLPARLATPIGLVGPAAVGALTVAALDSHGHLAHMSTFAGTVVAFAAVHRTGRLTHGLVAGFVVVWLLNALAFL